MPEVKYPEVEVQLLGEDGNAFAIIGNVTKAMRESGIPKVEIDKYRNEAMSGNYNKLLRVTMQTVNVL